MMSLAERFKLDKELETMSMEELNEMQLSGERLYLHGIKRDDILELLHKNTEGVVFHGFSNYEYEKFHSIGVFKDKVPEYLKQANPLKVSFRKDVNKKKIVSLSSVQG